MKLAILSFVVMSGLSMSASAMFDVPSTYPSDSGWAIAMTENACGVKFNKGVTGSIESVSGGVMYVVQNSKGQVLAAAKAKNTSVFAAKTCL